MDSIHHRNIETGCQLRESLRAGPYAWPGGYALYYVVNDGAALCPACVRDNARLILRSIRERACDGWRVVGSGLVEELCDDMPGYQCDNCHVELSDL